MIPLKTVITAVENGNADCAMVSSIKLSADRNLLGMNLVVVDGSTAVSPVYIGVSESANPLLAQVLSKSIAKAGEGAMDEAVYATLLSGKENKDFSYFIQTYPYICLWGYSGFTAGSGNPVHALRCPPSETAESDSPEEE